MPAGPIGAVWKTGSWSATAWEANSWANQSQYPSILEDLTTLFAHYVEDLHDANLTRRDSNQLVRDDLPNILNATNVDDDRNTQYAQALS